MYLVFLPGIQINAFGKPRPFRDLEKYSRYIFFLGAVTEELISYSVFVNPEKIEFGAWEGDINLTNLIKLLIKHGETPHQVHQV